MLLSIATAALVLVSSPAMAASENWYSEAKPLIAWDDDPATRQALAFGTAYTKNGYLKNHTNYRDPRQGGNKVYTETRYSYHEWCTTEVAWCGLEGKDQSARDNSGTWVDQYDNDDYSDKVAEEGRVHVKVCEDQPNSPDACSRQPFYTFSL
ncbi:MAG: hypothetical protein NTX33_18125 [Propionibacteriales bacterium]|nr:hypothetical protein [Propionibacteriales bacterium]